MEESLLRTNQVSENGIYIDEVSHKFGGNQCLIINHNKDDEVIIPFKYEKGHTILDISLPTEQELNDLPLFPITSDQSWNLHNIDTVNFDSALLKQEQI